MANYEIGPQFTVEQNEDGTIKLINLQTLLFRKRARYVIDTGFRYLGADGKRILVHNAPLNAGKFETVHERHSDFTDSLRITVIPCEECSLTIAKWSVIALISIEKQSLAMLKPSEVSVEMQDDRGRVIADPHPALELTKEEQKSEQKVAEEKHEKVKHHYDDRDVAQLFKLLPDVCEEKRLQILEQMEAMQLRWKQDGMYRAVKRLLKQRYQRVFVDDICSYYIYDKKIYF